MFYDNHHPRTFFHSMPEGYVFSDIPLLYHRQPQSANNSPQSASGNIGDLPTGADPQNISAIRPQETSIQETSYRADDYVLSGHPRLTRRRSFNFDSIDDQQYSTGIPIYTSPSPIIPIQQPLSSTLYHYGSLPTLYSQPISGSPVLSPAADTIESPRVPTESETERYLRRNFNVTDSRPMNLYVLPDPPFGPHARKPHITELIQLAIWGSEGHRATLNEIYAAVEERYPSYATMQDKPWQRSIRHSLSLKAMFVRMERPADIRGKGWYWTLDISKGDDNEEHRTYRNRKDIVSRARGVRESSHSSTPSASRPSSRVRARDSNVRLHAVHASDARLAMTPDAVTSAAAPTISMTLLDSSLQGQLMSYQPTYNAQGRHIDEFASSSGAQTHSPQMADLLGAAWMSDSPPYSSNSERGSPMSYGTYDSQPQSERPRRSQSAVTPEAGSDSSDTQQRQVRRATYD